VASRLALPRLFAGLTPARVLIALALAALATVVLVGALNAYVLWSARGAATDQIDDLPHTQAAIVPGAFVHDDGHMSSMLADRVQRAGELYAAGKVDKVLVSGDHGSWAYDEPDTMRKALVAAGVPERDIFTDHAGFNTRATMVRASEVFQVESAIVVTQGFHMARSLYLGESAGLEIHGLTSDLSDYGAQGAKSDIRELFARSKAVGETSLNSDVTLGPVIPITGDGRASRGPAPPPGTPPSGSPGP
jgi:SanA protein